MFNLYIQFKDDDRPGWIHWSTTNSFEQILEDFFYYKYRADALKIEWEYPE